MLIGNPLVDTEFSYTADMTSRAHLEAGVPVEYIELGNEVLTCGGLSVAANVFRCMITLFPQLYRSSLMQQSMVST